MFGLEMKELPGYYEIPGYSNYGVTLDGRVLNVVSCTHLDGSMNPDGYYNFRLTGDDGKCHTWGRHRLLAYVFKNPNCSITDLVVNHINGVKGDDRIVNLEWTTYQGNAEHAGMFGLTTKCIPISVRNTITGEVCKFASMVQFAREAQLSRDAISYRVKCGERRIFPELRQYRVGHGDYDWYAPTDYHVDVLDNGVSKTVLMRDVITLDVTVFDRLSCLADHLKVSPSTVTGWMNRSDQPVLPGLIQLKLASDRTPWREVTNPQGELSKWAGVRSVQTVCQETGETVIYSSALKCAEARCLKPTALNYRLQTGGPKTWPDGYSYQYCD